MNELEFFGPRLLAFVSACFFLVVLLGNNRTPVDVELRKETLKVRGTGPILLTGMSLWKYLYG